MEVQIQATLNFSICECSECGVRFGLQAFYKSKLQETHQTFYCPNGHSQYFPGETEAEKLRKELKRKEQELANKVIEKINVENELLKTQRKLKRVHNGTCPCCKRTFQNLKRHMETKHPELVSK